MYTYIYIYTHICRIYICICIYAYMYTYCRNNHAYFSYTARAISLLRIFPRHLIAHSSRFDETRKPAQSRPLKQLRRRVMMGMRAS